MNTTKRDGAVESPAKSSEVRAERRKRLWGALRVGGYAVVVVTGFGACSLKTAAAHTRDSLDEMGAGLLANASALGDSTRVTINGATMYGGARDVPLDLDAALDRIEGACRQPAATVNPNWLRDSLEGPLPQATPDDGSRLARIGIDRRHGEGTGSIVCVQPSRRPEGFGSWVDGVRTFAESGDLGALGKVRYVVARPSGPHSTLVASVWTEGTFNVRDMVGFVGDAPGSDIAGVPRPAGSRRILSAEVVGGHYGVHSYDCAGAIGQELAAYDKVMAHEGWERTATGLSTAKNAPAAAAHLDETSRAFVQRGVAILVDATTEPDGHTRIDVVEMGGARAKAELADGPR